MFVNYIIEREAFARHARDNGYTGNEQLFWYALFTIFNERASRNGFVWADGFVRIANKEILSWVPFTENTLMQVRADMVNPAKHSQPLIEYLKGRRNADMPQYKMRYFTPLAENMESYLKPRGNIGGNVGGNTWGNMGGNTGGNMGDITVNINQTNQQAVIDSGKKIYFNQAWRTDARARRAVAQNILDTLGVKGISSAGRANDDICYYIERGMTPDQVLVALDGIQDAAYVSGWLHTAAVNMGLEEENDCV